MATKIIEKQHTLRIGRLVTPPDDHEAVREILRETAGLWRGKKLDPLAYQRAMRRSYATILKKR